MDPVKEAGTLLQDRAGHVRNRVEGAVQTGRDRLELNIHKHPLETVLVSVGAGLVVGLLLGLLGRRSSD